MNWLEHTKIIQLNPCEVDLQDPTYWVPCFEEIEPLIRSIEHLGIINTPVVQERIGASPVPVLGRRRLAAAAKLGIPQTEVKLISNEISEQDGFTLAFWDNLGHRRLDAASVAVVVKRLFALFPGSTVAGRFLPALGIPPHGPKIERLCSIGGLDISILEALASGRIQEKTARLLVKIEPQERRSLMRLAEGLGLNANKKHEIIAALFDLSVHGGVSIGTLLDNDAACSILSDNDMSVTERGTRFRELVRSWKYPELVRREKEFRNRLEGMKIASRVAIRPTAGFESPQCTIEIRCETLDQATAAVTRLRDDPMLRLEREEND